jgi:hypothetical protein
VALWPDDRWPVGLGLALPEKQSNRQRSRFDFTLIRNRPSGLLSATDDIRSAVNARGLFKLGFAFLVRCLYVSLRRFFEPG